MIAAPAPVAVAEAIVRPVPAPTPVIVKPALLDHLGSNPEFIDGHGLTPVQFKDKLSDLVADNDYDRSYVNYVARSAIICKE